jgi:hypothetical protein
MLSWALALRRSAATAMALRRSAATAMASHVDVPPSPR